MPLITTHPTAAFPSPPHELLHDLPHDPSFDLAHGLPPSGAHRPSLRNPDDAGVPPLARFKAPATCGELIQGCLDGHDFLVNCPIDLYAYAELQPTSTPGISVSDVAHHGKIDHGIALLTDRLADHWGRPWGAAHGGASAHGGRHGPRPQPPPRSVSNPCPGRGLGTRRRPCTPWQPGCRTRPRPQCQPCCSVPGPRHGLPDSQRPRPPQRQLLGLRNLPFGHAGPARIADPRPPARRSPAAPGLRAV